MRRVAIAQLGSNDLDQVEFAKRLAKRTIQKIVPRALRVATALHPSKEHREKLEAAANQCELEGTEFAAKSAAQSAAQSAARSADTELSFAAEEIVQILIEMKSPGTQWLDLTE